MRLVTYEIEHREGLGVMSRDGKWIFPLRSMDMDYKTMQQLIENISESEKQLLEYMSSQDPYKIRGAAPIEEVKLLAPIPHPRQDVICWESTIWTMRRNPPGLRRRSLTGRDPTRCIFPRG